MSKGSLRFHCEVHCNQNISFAVNHLLEQISEKPALIVSNKRNNSRGNPFIYLENCIDWRNRWKEKKTLKCWINNSMLSYCSNNYICAILGSTVVQIFSERFIYIDISNSILFVSLNSIIHGEEVIPIDHRRLFLGLSKAVKSIVIWLQLHWSVEVRFPACTLLCREHKVLE